MPVAMMGVKEREEMMIATAPKADRAAVMKAINDFVMAANAMLTASFDADGFAEHNRDRLVLGDPGVRYVRVVRENASGTGRSVYAFIDLATGDLYKPASWKGPAKHVRSNVLAADCGLSGAGVYAVKYLR